MIVKRSDLIGVTFLCLEVELLYFFEEFTGHGPTVFEMFAVNFSEFFYTFFRLAIRLE